MTRRLVALAAARWRRSLPAPAERGHARRAVGRFSEPVFVTGPPGAGGRLFVVERRGTIRVVRRGRRLRRPFLDIRRQVLIRSPFETVDQRGLLSVAFAPDYARSGRFYVFFVDRRDRIRVDELRRSALEPGPRRSRVAAHAADDPRRREAPPRRPARLRAGRRALRGRRLRRPGGDAAGSREPAREDPAPRPRRHRARRRSGRAGCATRTASRSTAAAWSSRTSAATSPRRSRC